MLHKTPEDLISWAEKNFTGSTANYDFTMHMLKYVKANNEDLFNRTIELLEKGNYAIKYLSYCATS